MAHRQNEVTQLKAQVAELMHINNEWDKDYREQTAAFARYRDDTQRAQMENQNVIQRLKDKVGTQEEDNMKLRDNLDRYQREIRSLRKRILSLENVKRLEGGGSVKELQEEIALLRQQLKAYQEDFEAEKRDRERLCDEKQSASLKYEAEITSLKLQLDRCRNDLAHYTSEAGRLAHQLKLKHQHEEDKYRQHLESKGFVSRSANGLPPLDPYVENDQNPPSLPPRYSDWVELNLEMVNGSGSGSGSGVGLHNGVAGSRHGTMEPNSAVCYTNGSVSPLPQRRGGGGGGQDHQIRLLPRGHEDSATPPPVLSSSSSSSSSPEDRDGIKIRGRGIWRGGGQYSCPRCARQFRENPLFLQHKERCLS